MSQNRAKQAGRENLWIGVLLMLFGLVFLGDRLDLIELRDVRVWWPLIPTGIGLAQIVLWRSADSVGSGVTWALLGLWFWASLEGWYGLSWINSWPLALAAIGSGMVAKSLLGPLFPVRDDSQKKEMEKEEGHVG